MDVRRRVCNLCLAVVAEIRADLDGLRDETREMSGARPSAPERHVYKPRFPDAPRPERTRAFLERFRRGA